MNRTSFAHHALLANSAALAFAAVAFACSSADAAEMSTSRPVRSDALQIQIEQMPERDLKRLHLDCSRAAVRTLLGFGQAAVCSVAHEVLLKVWFADDFDALQAWSKREQR